MAAKQKGLSRQEKRKLQDLESDLFGGQNIIKDIGFGNEAAELAERIPEDLYAVDAIDNAQPLFIWEDRGRSGANVADESSESDEDEDGNDAKCKVQNAGTSEECSDTDLGTSSRIPHPQGKPRGQVIQEPAWEDSEEENVIIDIAGQNRARKLRKQELESTIKGSEYSKRLKQQHAKLNPRTSWASLKRKRKQADTTGIEATDIQDLEQGASRLLSSNQVLPADLLQATRLKDANHRDPSNAAIRSLEFHPNGELLFTAGLDKKIKFFQVDGIENASVQTVFLDDLPIHKAAFACTGSKVIASGRRKYFYLFDLGGAKTERILANGFERSLENFAISPVEQTPLLAFLGSKGSIPLVSLSSRQTVGQLKISGQVKSATFSSDGLTLFASGSDGVINAWDMRTQRCMSRVVDEGALTCTALATSPTDRFLATGSDAGFVNIYHQHDVVQAGMASAQTPLQSFPLQPAKTFTSLLTAVDLLSFNPDGQILAMASKAKKDALRLIHTGSMTVFSNWPTSRSPIHSVSAMCFSPGGGYLAMGSARGRVLLYRMHHYDKA